MENKFYNGKDKYYKIVNKMEEGKYIAEWFLNDNYIEQREIKIDILTDEYIKNNLKEISEAEYYITLCNYSDGILVIKNLKNIFNSSNVFNKKDIFDKLMGEINSNINGLYTVEENDNYTITITELKDKQYLIIYANSKEILYYEIIETSYKLGEIEYKYDNKRYFFNEGEYHVVIGESGGHYICLDENNKIYETKKDGFEVELSIQQYLLETNIKSNLKDLVDYLKYCSKVYEIKFGINLLRDVYINEDIIITYKRISRTQTLLIFEDLILKDGKKETAIINNCFLDLQDALENVDKYYFFFDNGFQFVKLIKEEKGYYIFEGDIKKRIEDVCESNELEYLLSKSFVQNIDELEKLIEFLNENRRWKHKRIKVEDIEFFYKEYTKMNIKFNRIDNEKTLISLTNNNITQAKVLEISDKIA